MGLQARWVSRLLAAQPDLPLREPAVELQGATGI
jgi:hypothetical protein